MRALVVLTLLASISPAFAAPASPAATATIPETPAGRVFHAWLDAFNSGDRATVAAYCKRYASSQSPDELLAFRRHIGGFDLVAIRDSQPLRVAFQLQERGSPRNAIGSMTVKDGATPTVASFTLNVIPPGMTPDQMNVNVDATLRGRIIDVVVAKLTQFYIYPAVAQKMVDALRAHQKHGEYDSVTDGYTLASLLTEHLKAVSHDGHLRVECAPEVLPKDDPKDDDAPPPEFVARMQHDNCGFEKVEHLESNIGYIKFNFFGDPKVCGPTATAAINLLPNVDALIFDLRDNHGGSPEMVAWVVSYLFAQRTHINDLYNRHDNKTVEFWTTPDVPGKKFLDKPVYVLTSKGTFSGGEEFTYDLKTQKRATIVGEATGGGAHPTRPYRVDDHFWIGVPDGRPINPITKGDWEGKGVEPDVKAPADQALDVAQKLAREAVAKRQPPPPAKKK
jgi:hypothetical protein